MIIPIMDEIFAQKLSKKKPNIEGRNASKDLIQKLHKATALLINQPWHHRMHCFENTPLKHLTDSKIHTQTSIHSKSNLNHTADYHSTLEIE